MALIAVTRGAYSTGQPTAKRQAAGARRRGNILRSPRAMAMPDTPGRIKLNRHLEPDVRSRKGEGRCLQTAKREQQRKANEPPLPFGVGAWRLTGPCRGRPPPPVPAPTATTGSPARTSRCRGCRSGRTGRCVTPPQTPGGPPLPRGPRPALWGTRGPASAARRSRGGA